MKIPSIDIIKFFPRKDRLIGLDIGSFSIKLAELTRQQGTLILTKLKLQEIDPHKDNQNSQLDALKNMFNDINIQGARVNLVVNCSRSCTKISVIPFMPKSEILLALKWEMRNFLSFPMDQAAIDYEILQEINEDGIKKFVSVQAELFRSPSGFINDGTAISFK